MYDHYFSEDHKLFRESLRKFLDREVKPFIDEWEEQRRIPKELWKKFGEMGYLGLNMPEAHGGQDLDFFYSVIFLEEISKCYSGGFAITPTVQQYMASPYLLHAGSDFLKEKYLTKAISGEWICSIAISEPGAGSDVANIQTRAIREGDHYVVNGSKTFITNGVYGDFLVTVVKTDPEAGVGGISLLVIDRQAEGVSATKLKKLGWHASDTAELAFDNVRVPVENLIGQEGQGFYYLMGGLQLERLAGALLGVGACELALDYTLSYMRERQAFGRPISKFQVLRHRIADLASELEAVRAFVYHLCNVHNTGGYAVKECSMAKLLATELSDKTMYQCLQMFGGYGYMEEYKIARMFRDSRIGTIGGGTSEIMREIIAKMVIDDASYDRAFSASESGQIKKQPGSTNGHANGHEESSIPDLARTTARVENLVKDKPPLGVNLKFDFGDGLIRLDGSGNQNQVLNEDGQAACIIGVSLADFNALLEGKLDPMSAFMAGKFKVEGDMSQAMKLKEVFAG